MSRSLSLPPLPIPPPPPPPQLLLALLLLMPQLLDTWRPCAGAPPAHWGYGSDEGPKHWPRLYKRWCSGRKQSPIRLALGDSVHDKSLDTYIIREPNYSGSQYKLKNDGHKVLVDFNNVKVNVSLNHHAMECFRPHSVHWHWGDRNEIGSEHWLEGKQLPMEAHIVMWDCRFWDSFEEAATGIDGLAVLGIFYEVDNSVEANNQTLNSLIEHFKKPEVEHCDECATEGSSNAGVQLPAFSIKELLPSDITSYYLYYGSLTTPDCRENVLWTVFRETVKISQRTMDAFRSLRMPKDSSGKRAPMVNNFRGPRPLNPSDPIGARRQLSRSFKAGSAVRASLACLLASAMALATTLA